MKLIDQIEKVYVLTIARNEDRHDSVKHILRGIDFDFWGGIDLKVQFPKTNFVSELSDEFFQKYCIDKNHVQPWTLGQLGAYTSIKEMILSVVKNNYPATLFFEDDFYPLLENWRAIFKCAFEELPADWDILLLGYNYDGKAYKHAYKRWARLFPKLINHYNFIFKKMPKRIMPNTFSKHLDTAGICNGGHAYCISAKGANLLKQYLVPMKRSGDELVSELIQQEKIKAYAVYPCLFLQNPVFPSKTR